MVWALRHGGVGQYVRVVRADLYGGVGPMVWWCGPTVWWRGPYGVVVWALRCSGVDPCFMVEWTATVQ